MILLRFQQESEGVQQYQNSLHFKFFPISVEGGGLSKINFFPNSKQSKLSWGGSRKLWTFYTICDIFFWMAPLRKIGYLLARGYLYYAEIEYYNQLCVQSLIQMKKILQLGGVWWSDQVEIRLTQLSTQLNFSNFNTVGFS